MNEQEKKVALNNLKKEIDKLEKKECNFYFFVMDTKGNPSGTLQYIYQIAYALNGFGYKVTMLHQEENFVGVEAWMGEQYASLPHKNIEKENVDISPSDFLFIPEIYANVMSQTKKLPCRRICVFTNENYLTSTIPVGVTYDDLGVFEAITNTEYNKKVFNDYFPYVKVHVIPPIIPNAFRNTDKAKKLIVNVISDEQTDIEKIMKPFYWKYPVYKWVSFRDLRGLPTETLATALNEAAITIWIDDKASFGFTLLEALKSGSIVLAKIPDNLTDWMAEDGNLINGPIWFDNFKSVPEMIASIVRTWTLDEIPEELYKEMSRFDDKYTAEKGKAAISDVFEGIVNNQREDFKRGLEFFEKQAEKNNEE